MTWVKRTLIVPSAKQSLAQQLCSGLAGPGGGNMFITRLSTSGTVPATHYISSGMIEEEFAIMLTDASLIKAACDNVGIVITLAAIQSLLSASDVSEEEPFIAINRLGLKMIQEPL